MDTPTNLLDHIKIGAYVNVAEWVGRIEDIAIGQSHTMILVSSPKQLYRHSGSEWLEWRPENPGLIKPATESRYLDECQRYSEMVSRLRYAIDDLMEDVAAEHLQAASQ